MRKNENEIRVGGKSILKKPRKHLKNNGKFGMQVIRMKDATLQQALLLCWPCPIFYLYYNVIYQAQFIFSIFFKKPFEFDWKQGTCCKDGQLW